MKFLLALVLSALLLTPLPVAASGGVPIDPGSGTGGVAITSYDGVPAAARQPVGLSSNQVATTTSGLTYSPENQTFNGTVTVTNISSIPIGGPLQILFSGVPYDVSLVNATGNLGGRTPYLTVPIDTSLAPSQSVTVSVQLKNPSNATLVNLVPEIYSGNFH